ncbi:MAG: DUF871 domain-containing protein [Selenomonadaceae bacterium]|nr:DUF871 domain-containing protein [Selenomonadaceae bacterium]
MRNGISVYAGLGYSVEENISLIEKAAALGMKKIFTSAHIPESFDGGEKFFEEFTEIISTAVKNNFEVILDVDSEHISEFDFEGLTIRLDDGFNVQQISELSRKKKIQLNASTITNNFLISLKNNDADFKNISALHNFYPHIHTGLDTYFFENQNKILHDFGISVGAFVPSQKGRRRPPLFEGLPTLEDCRNFSTDLSARFLAALGTDFIIIGDGLPTDEEVAAVSIITDDEIIMTTELLTDDETTIGLLNNSFTRRPDISKSVIRAVEGRKFLKESGGTIQPDNSPVERNFGDITVDNSNFGRYEGEIQIVENILPPDSRVNRAAKISDQESFLKGYIKPGQKFSFRFADVGGLSK